MNGGVFSENSGEEILEFLGHHWTPYLIQEVKLSG
jgi:hypothetical protein